MAKTLCRELEAEQQLEIVGFDYNDNVVGADLYSQDHLGKQQRLQR